MVPTNRNSASVHFRSQRFHQPLHPFHERVNPVTKLQRLADLLNR